MAGLGRGAAGGPAPLPDPEAVLAESLETVTLALGAQAATILREDPVRGWLPLAGWPVGERSGVVLAPLDTRAPRPASGRAAEAIALDDAGDGQATTWSVTCPASAAAEAALAVRWAAPRGGLTARERAILRMAARQVCLVLDRASAAARVEAAEGLVRRKTDLHRALSRARRAATQGEDPSGVARAVCRALADGPTLRLAWVGWVDAATGTLRPATWAGSRVRALAGAELAVGAEASGPAAAALRDGQVHLGPEPTLPPEVAGVVGSWAWIPLRDGPRAGMLAIGAADPTCFAPTDMPYLDELGRHLEHGLLRLTAQGAQVQGEASLRTVFDTVLDGLVLMDESGRIEVANPALGQMVGRDTADLVGADIGILLGGPHADALDRTIHGALRGEPAAPVSVRTDTNVVQGRRADGSAFPISLLIRKARTAPEARFAGVVRDLSPEMAYAREREHALAHDPLTGLWNRSALHHHLEQLQAVAAIAPGGREALVLVDVDDFQDINATYDAEGGDRVLISLGRRLASVVDARAGGMAARIGGDEFALVVPLTPGDDARAWAEAAMRVAARPVKIDGRTCRVRLSAGLVVLPEDARSVQEALTHADLALHEAKAGGGGTLMRYAAAMERRAERVRVLPDRLRAALAAGQLHLYYQPQVNMVTREVRAFEALARWHDPERGLVMPTEFLPLLRDREVVVRVGEWVIDTALAQWRTWADAGIDSRVAVNVAPEHFLQPGFAARLRRRLRKLGPTARGALEVEITESAAIADTDRGRQVMAELSAMGVRLALDDFGTGYASIAYLSDLPFDAIKIDRSFTQRILGTDAGWAIARAILLMGTGAEREVVAEGVESATLEDGLLRLGARFGQGFLYGRAMPAAEVPGWLVRWRAASAARPPRARAVNDASDYMTAVHQHMRWAGRLMTVLGHRGVDAAAGDVGDERGCAFVRWCERYGEGRASMRRIAALHARSHRAARELFARLPAHDARVAGAQAAEALMRDTESFLVEALAAFDFRTLVADAAAPPDGDVAPASAR